MVNRAHGVRACGAISIFCFVVFELYLSGLNVNEIPAHLPYWSDGSVTAKISPEGQFINWINARSRKALSVGEKYIRRRISTRKTSFGKSQRLSEKLTWNKTYEGLWKNQKSDKQSILRLRGSESKVEQAKVILLWTTRWGKENWLSKRDFRDCSRKCHVTTNKFELNRSNAVLFHDGDFSSEATRPPRHLPHRPWVYFNMESPLHTRARSHLSEFDGLFNWTASYRSDSNLVMTYGRKQERKIPTTYKAHRQFLNNLSRTKPRLALARISHCNQTSNHRLPYITELRKYIKVDVVGKCGEKFCPKHSKYCDYELPKQYMFFLAFENSCCPDYITEKFWNTLRNFNSVPVVMGGASGLGYEYKTSAPPNSYINAAHFTSAKELGEFLLKVSQNKTLYEGYFDWLRRYEVILRPDWCQLCDALHDEQKIENERITLREWIMRDACSRGSKDKCAVDIY